MNMACWFELEYIKYAMNNSLFKKKISMEIKEQSKIQLVNKTSWFELECIKYVMNNRSLRKSENQRREKKGKKNSNTTSE